MVPSSLGTWGPLAPLCMSPLTSPFSAGLWEMPAPAALHSGVHPGTQRAQCRHGSGEEVYPEVGLPLHYTQKAGAMPLDVQGLLHLSGPAQGGCLLNMMIYEDNPLTYSSPLALSLSLSHSHTPHTKYLLLSLKCWVPHNVCSHTSVGCRVGCVGDGSQTVIFRVWKCYPTTTGESSQDSSNSPLVLD